MIYQFRCSCQESPNFQIDIQMDATHSFFDLHQSLQSALNFQSLFLASFFVPTGKRGQSIEISQLESGESKPLLHTMKNTLLEDILSKGKKSLRYVFDLINDRYLQLELTEIKMEKNLRKPLVEVNRGEAPVQEMDEVLTSELYKGPEEKGTDPDYGILHDYYEIFGEMEEYVL